MSRWPGTKALSTAHGELWSGICVKFGDVNNLFRFFDFRDFLEKHFQFCIRYLMGCSKYSQNVTRQYQTLLYINLS